MEQQPAIYLDNHATTPVDPRVLETMVGCYQNIRGNAASISHRFGREAAEVVERARTEVASLLNATDDAVIFTSGATEADNLALKGVMWAAPPGSHLVTCVAEHRAVLDPADYLKRRGYEVTRVPVDSCGQVAPEDVRAALRDDTALASVMAVNNEVGTCNDLAAIGEICRERGVLFHTDAAQAVGKLRLDWSELPVDLLSLSGHKLYGPQGIGALFVRRGRRRIRMDALFHGGGHERRLRSGTLPTALIAGLGTACRLAGEVLEEESARIRELRDRLWSRLTAELDGLLLNGHPQQRVAGNLNFSVEGVDGDALMTGLTQIAVSSGSACTSADPEPSHVLRAMGRSDVLSLASLRFGIGRFNTSAEIDTAAGHVIEVIRRLREVGSGDAK